MHHLGVLAHSADGAALCFLEMVREGARRLAEHDHPEITLSILAQRAKADGRRCVGLLGTRWTMAGPVYPSAFARAGLDMKTPPADDCEIVNDVIFRELTQGVIRDESRAEYVRVIEGLKRSGCDVVALSCTEIPLLVTPDVSPLPTLDSTRLLARAAVAVACGDSALPGWRGGRFA